MAQERLKDNHGRTVGFTETVRGKQHLYDSHSRPIGTFDGKTTRDNHGQTVGTGNLLGTLLK